jgi:hypothetical protein
MTEEVYLENQLLIVIEIAYLSHLTSIINFRQLTEITVIDRVFCQLRVMFLVMNHLLHS